MATAAMNPNETARDNWNLHCMVLPVQCGLRRTLQIEITPKVSGQSLPAGFVSLSDFGG